MFSTDAESDRINSQKRLDVEVVSSKDDLEEHLLVDRNELLVPFADVSSPLARLILALVGIRCGQRLATMVLAIIQDLCRYQSAIHGHHAR